MERGEKIVLIVLLAVFLFGAVCGAFVATIVHGKTDDAAAPTAAPIRKIETADSCVELSADPCELSAGFAEWLKRNPCYDNRIWKGSAYEQEAKEKDGVRCNATRVEAVDENVTPDTHEQSADVMDDASVEAGSEIMANGEGDRGTHIQLRKEITIYAVDGVVLAPKLQEYAYQCCEEAGIEWYYPHLLCQMYQESRFNQAAVSVHNCYGVMQLKDKYHAYFAELAGIPGADLINDVYANIRCGVFIMAKNLRECGDLNAAISTYLTGTTASYSAEYVQQVRQWEATLQEIGVEEK